MSRLYLVADVGGTTLRTGWAEAGSAAVLGVRRQAVEGIARFPAAPVAELQARVVDQLVRVLRERLRAAPRPPSAVAVAFAGPVDGAGVISDAPTVWGRRGPALPLAEILSSEVEVPTRVLNDVAAAGWRYVAPAPADEDFFCMVTVSSGVGNKVFRGGEVLLPHDGRGGEIGHLRVDFSPNAPPCDCGGQGHLGAIASGRGTLNAARTLAATLPRSFARSALHAACDGEAARLTAHHVASGFRGGDTFAVRAVTPGVRHLARVLAAVNAALGVRRFVVMGGFARAAGPAYLRLLGEEMAEAVGLAVAAGEVPAMVHAAAPDDDDGLIGCVCYLDRHGHHDADGHPLPGFSPTVATAP
ncbi:ROK family protein [Streptomyces sp. NPDC058620]|uniref:ROK family protein n=1 Tax=Streptomyces sp. NPDC058620 TaxID=3346560 RepID=UPI0036685827